MKKILIRVALVLVVLVAAGLAIVWFKLNSIVKTSVETVGPHLTQTEVKLDSVNLSPFSGSGELKGLLIGNPQGYTAPEAIKLDELKIAVSIGSLSGDKIVVRSIVIDGANITMEGGLKENNLTKIRDNLQAASSGKEATPATTPKDEKAEAKASRKIEVGDIQIRNAKVHLKLSVLGTINTTVPIPDIHLTNLGTGAEGITVGDLSKRVFNEILDKTLASATDAVADLGKGATDAAKGLLKGAGTNLDKATKGLGDLFKKK